MRSIVVRLVQLAVGVALFAYVLSLSSPSEMRDAMTSANVALLVAAVLLNIPLALLFGVRSSFVLAKLGYRIDLRTAMPIAIVGNVAGALTPASSGEIIRGVLLHSRADVAARDGAALVLFERGLSVYLIVLATALAALLLVVPAYWVAPIALAMTPLLLVPGVAVPLLARLLTRDAAADGNRVVRWLRQAVEGVAGLTSNATLVARWSAVTLVMIAITAAQYWLVARSLGDGVVFHEALLAYGASQLAGIVSLLPLGLGSSDATLISLTRRFGLTYDQAASGAVLVRLVSTLPLIAIAVASYAYLQSQRPRVAAARDSREANEARV
jgi:uncharacterized protein (TIRG00374 family)